MSVTAVEAFEECETDAVPYHSLGFFAALPIALTVSALVWIAVGWAGYVFFH